MAKECASNEVLLDLCYRTGRIGDSIPEYATRDVMVVDLDSTQEGLREAPSNEPGSAERALAQAE